MRQKKPVKTGIMKSKKTVCRKCVSCGSIIDKDLLLRIAKNREGVTRLDMTGFMEGRGAYICKSRKCLEKALDKNLLERSFRAGIRPEDKERLKKETEGLGQ